MSIIDKALAAILQGANPDSTPEDIQAQVDSLKKTGGSAVNQALSFIPGLNSVKDAAVNAPELAEEAGKTPLGASMASSLTGGPISNNIPNAGNPVSNISQSYVASLANSDPAKPAAPVAATPDATPTSPPVDTPIPQPISSAAPSSAQATAAKKAEDAALSPSSNDEAVRTAGLADIESKRKKNLIPSVIAGAGDAIGKGLAAFGVHTPTDSQEKVVAASKEGIETNKKELEKGLRDNPKSDISKQYQALVAQFMKRDMNDPLILGLSANQIAEKIPAIEKIASMHSAEDIERMKLQAASAKAGAAQTTAQKAVDKQFGHDYAQYVAGGGYADTMSQIGNLESVLTQLNNKNGSNLTGAGLSMLPEFIRKRTFADSAAAQQAVEQSIQRTLRTTLGAQFTENEGRLFMQRSYDPNLDEAHNAKKLESAINQLKLMAMAKQEAIDYYEENNTLDGFKGKFYTLQNGAMKQATKDDFLNMMKPVNSVSQPIASKPTSGDRKTKSGISYSVER